jgi:4-aminobutyrate aminotransferase/(S)-3-amino-2-methylpropionate transaminase
MATIQLKTQIPGPKSKALAQRRAHAVPRGLSQATPIYLAKAEDAVLEDVDGNRYIDFAGGIGCQNTGHRAPGIVGAIQKQLDKFLHVCVQVTGYESYVRLAERIRRRPGIFRRRHCW